MKIRTEPSPRLHCMRVLVTGGRDFQDIGYVFRKLGELHALHRFKVLIHGDAPGVDQMADRWCFQHGVQPARCPALWDFWKTMGKPKAAGSIRNRDMLILQPQMVIAFPGGRGTADMIAAADDEEIPLLDLSSDYSTV